MTLFDISAILISLAAVLGYVNYRLLKLPATTGILSLALLGSLLMLLADWAAPSLSLRESAYGFLAKIDFNEALMHGMLCFLLFAGALHLRLEDLQKNKWTILALATMGVILSTLLVGLLAYGIFLAFGLQVSLPLCFVFGALISPTDPIAVLGLLKLMRVPKHLEATIAGESLFNDGMGVVLFTALLPLAGLGAVHASPAGALDLLKTLVWQVAGGVALGLGCGYVAYRALKSINYHQLELLITLALVMFSYAVSFFLGVSGPIAVVVAGLVIGNHGKRFAMSRVTARHVNAFWGMMDDILNAVLFLLIGLIGFGPHLNLQIFSTALAIVAAVLFSRFLSVLLPIAVLHWKRRGKNELIAILTWGGLRGGLSVAMALSLPASPEKEILMTCTYSVVLFSVLVQGSSMRPLLSRLKIVRGPKLS